MNVALLSRQTLHTEVMGFLISVLHELGHTISIFYNVMDPWHMIDYYRRRFPYIKETESIQLFFRLPLDAYDRIILITSDEWNNRQYRRQINSWNESGKLLVLHHDTCYLKQYPQFRRYIGLMPCYGPDHYTFPLYNKPIMRDIHVSNMFILPSLFCCGSLDSKDQDDVGRFIDFGGKVVNYVRYPANTLIEKHGEHFECVSNLDGIALMNALTERIGSGRGHMWFPIKQDTSYATEKYSGSLTLGVDIGAVLVMPDILRRSLQLPTSAVITYDVTVTEPATINALCESMRDGRPWLTALHEWKRIQWENTQRIIKSMI